MMTDQELEKIAMRRMVGSIRMSAALAACRTLLRADEMAGTAQVPAEELDAGALFDEAARHARVALGHAKRCRVCSGYIAAPLLERDALEACDRCVAGALEEALAAGAGELLEALAKS